MDKRSIKEDAKTLFSDRLWTLDVTDLSSSKKRWVKFIKLIRITLDTFAENRMGFQCVALSYFCTLALIPMLALIFAVGNGLGIENKLYVLLCNIIPQQQEIINVLMEKATNIIDTAQSSIVGLVSALAFFWTIIWMMFQIERVFNNVWGLRKVPRKMYKRFSFYIIALILLPFIVIIFSFGIAGYTNALSSIGLNIKEWSTAATAIGWFAFFIVTVLTLSAMYKFIPATKVIYSNARTAAVVASFAFTIFQYLYLQTQMFVYRLNSVYGTLAAVPLFLMWLNFSWQIIIYGAELSYGLQNVEQYHIPDDGTLREFTAKRRARRLAKEKDDEKKS